MRVLLDTYTFLWWNMDAPELSPRARDVIADGHNEIYLSAASAWEIAIKASRGKLTLPAAPEKYVGERMVSHRFLALPVEVSHALRVYALPDIHRDPFDRLLVAQSQMERMPILTADDQIRQYGVDVIW
jgi:PIN domain nuclease of toxin-antitoxin system